MKTLLMPLAATALCCSLASADQTHTYPAENPLVSFTAPDDWKAEPKGNSLFVVSPDGGDMIVEIMSMEAAMDDDAAAVTEARGIVDKEKPDFTIDFPADWVMKDTDEGAYVESPDKLVAMNVIMVDKADTVDAEETLKKNVGERFKEIVWNGGKEPEVNKDDALGLDRHLPKCRGV